MDTEQAILTVASKRKKFRTSDVVTLLSKRLSRQYVSLILSRLVRKGALVRAGSGEFIYYALPENSSYLINRVHKRFANKNLKEHEVLENLKKEAPFTIKIGENIDSIFNYAFSEMFNNAIEHSQSGLIDIEIENDRKNLIFEVRDFGVGVFRNIMQKRHLVSEFEAIQDLLKGKTTTQPQSHSGEGIFFTSKVADLFILESFNYRLRIDNRIEDVFIEKINSLKGTRVTFEIAVDTKKHLNDIFTAYQTDPNNYAFDKTEIQIKLYNLGTIYVSRSQARRVLTNLEKFKLIVLDFDKVPTIGQAFADEIFRVFTQKQPQTQIKPINMNEAVRFMIGRVEK